MVGVCGRWQIVANREKGGMGYGMEGWEDRSLVFIDTFLFI
jgi:hypothetical protein